MTLTDVQMEAMLAALIAADGPFDPAAVFVGVGIGAVPSGPLAVRADITPALGTAGTATAVTTWGAAHKLQDGRWAADSPVKNFKVASADDHCILTCWYLASLATLGDLLGYGTIFPTVELVDEFSLYSLVVRLTVDPDGRWDANVMWNG